MLCSNRSRILIPDVRIPFVDYPAADSAISFVFNSAFASMLISVKKQKISLAAMSSKLVLFHKPINSSKKSEVVLLSCACGICFILKQSLYSTHQNYYVSVTGFFLDRSR